MTSAATCDSMGTSRLDFVNFGIGNELLRGWMIRRRGCDPSFCHSRVLQFFSVSSWSLLGVPLA